MFRVAYRSVLRADLGAAEIESLIRDGLDHNARMGVTSAFLMNDKRCLHALEGAPKVIRSILECIWDDRRNEEFAILDIAYGEAALFPGWPLKVITAETIEAEPELHDHPGVNWLANLDSGLSHYFTAPRDGSES
ncbi:BLUF domain-containing protein [Oceanicaulis sp. MMSF_3324]|uniref:BLUF domain-containing protein n=1 Tax=Oceanicaulis sp. MMSF_3324 TaxID=3046702 RepID=UPI00273F1BD6|nr:BLUF domain-containing protein [Oceanicaulis sp. MMSF_3324]